MALELDNLKPDGLSQQDSDKFELVQSILQGESFVDPLNPDDITRGYAAYDRDPQKIIGVVVSHFQGYCRKIIRNSAFIEHKNEIANCLHDEVDELRQRVSQEMFDKVKNDDQTELLLKMLIFKNLFWKWIRSGLKDVFDQQRAQPGHELNKYVNLRYQRRKNDLNLMNVGELVNFDIVEIINLCKQEILRKETKIFPVKA